VIADLLPLRAEIRKLASPSVGLAVVGSTALVCVLQRHHGGAPTGLANILRLALQHEATAVGVSVIAFGAAFGTARECAEGSLQSTLLAGVSPRWLLTIKSVALLALSSCSALLLIGSTWLLGRVDGVPAPGAAQAWKPLDVLSSFAVIAWTSLIASLLAVVLRSTIGTLLALTGGFFLPLSWISAPVAWATPTRWIVEVLRLDPHSEGVGYIAATSGYDARGGVWVLATVCLALTAGSALVLCPRALSRAATASRGPA
jgi:hypothetical protein